MSTAYDAARQPVDGFVASLESQIEQLNAHVTELEQRPPTQLIVGGSGTMYGACPQSGGSTLTAARTVTRKWGGGAAERQFLDTQIAQRPDDVSTMFWSWSYRASLAQISDPAWVESRLVNAKPGDRVAHVHEGDLKVKRGTLTFAQLVERQTKWFENVTAVRPDLVVVNVLTGGSLADYGKGAWRQYGQIPAHELGADLDGVHDKTAPLDIPYVDEIINVAAFLDEFAGDGLYELGWGVPEIGTSRPTYDMTGEQRAAWLQALGVLMRSMGANYALLYDYESTKGNVLTPGSPEFAVWESFVRSNTAA